MTRPIFIYSNSIGWYRILKVSPNNRKIVAVFFDDVDLIRKPILDYANIEVLVDISKNRNIDYLPEKTFKEALRHWVWFIFYNPEGDYIIPEDELGFLGFEVDDEVKDWTEKIQELNSVETLI